MALFEEDRRNREGMRFWDGAWPEDGVQSFSPHSRFIENTKWQYLISELNDSPGSSLEVGCGSGHLSALFAENGYSTFLLDYSLSAVHCAINSFQHYSGRESKHYLVGDALSLPHSPNTFDFVLSCGVLEHFENPLLPIREMARVLKPGGLFYADICPKKFSLINMISALHQSPPGWYEKRMNQHDIESLIGRSGLQIQRIFAAGVLPPRDLPGRGRFRFLQKLESFIIDRFAGLWMRLDGTVLAEWMGLYYYVTAIKK